MALSLKAAALAGLVVVTMRIEVAAVVRATPDEAQVMLQKAVAHYNAVGRKQALADFTGKKAPFSDRDLYVVCVGPKGIVTAHGGYPAYVGVSADMLKDATGKPVGTTIWNTGLAKGAGTLDYPMLNPLTNKLEKKHTFFQKVGDDVCAVGAYVAP